MALLKPFSYFILENGLTVSAFFVGIKKTPVRFYKVVICYENLLFPKPMIGESAMLRNPLSLKITLKLGYLINQYILSFQSQIC
jgi:hypothetical protein